MKNFLFLLISVLFLTGNLLSQSTDNQIVRNLCVEWLLESCEDCNSNETTVAIAKRIKRVTASIIMEHRPEPMYPGYNVRYDYSKNCSGSSKYRLVFNYHVKDVTPKSEGMLEVTTEYYLTLSDYEGYLIASKIFEVTTRDYSSIRAMVDSVSSKEYKDNLENMLFVDSRFSLKRGF